MGEDGYAFFDMDGTLTTTTFEDEYSSVWHVTAQVLGDDAVAAQEALVEQWNSGHDRFCRDGERDYELFVDATAAMHKKHGLTKEMYYEDVLDHLGFQPGVEETIDTLHDAGYRTAIVSGGMGPQADYVADILDIDTVYAACDYAWDEDGQLDDWDTYPSDHAGKTAFMDGVRAETTTDPEDVIFVGDGSNDIHIAQTVSRRGGTSIGYDPGEELAAVVDYDIDPDTQDFTAVLDVV